MTKLANGELIDQLGGASDRFCDYLCVDCANMLCGSGHNQFTNTKINRPITKILKSTH